MVGMRLTTSWGLTTSERYCSAAKKHGYRRMGGPNSHLICSSTRGRSLNGTRGFYLDARSLSFSNV